MSLRERFIRFLLRMTRTHAILPGDILHFNVELLDLWRDGPYQSSIVVRAVDIVQSGEDEPKVVMLTNA